MEPLRFATELIDALGGVVERDGEGAASLLLAPDLSARLGLCEEFRFVDAPDGDDDGAGGIPLLHGSEALERLAAEAIGSGRVATVRLDTPPPRGEAIEAMAARAFRPANGVVRHVEMLPGSAEYLVVGFHYTATGEERREGLVDASVDPAGTMTAPALAGLLWDGESPMTERGRVEEASIAPAAWRAAARMARARVVEVLAPVREILGHRLERDVTRLHGYYRSMQHDLLRTAARRALDPAELDKILLRVNGIPEELRRRLAEARARLSLRVSVRPIIALRVFVPAVFVRVRVLRRKEERELLLRCAGFQRACDEFLCEGCGVPAPAPVLCDDRVHLLCDACLWTCPSCGARTCLGCARRCRRCGTRPGDAPTASGAGRTTTAPPGERRAPSVPPATSIVAPDALRPSVPSRPSAAPPVGTAVHTAAPTPRPLDPAAPGGRRALADLARQLGPLFGTGGPEDMVRVGLRALGEAGVGTLARHTGLEQESVQRTLAGLRRSGQVVLFGHGRGARYRLAEERQA